MRPPFLRNGHNEPQRSITVGAETGTVAPSDNGGFWKGLAVGVGGLLVLGATVSLVNGSMERDIARQNAEDEYQGRLIVEQARRRDRVLDKQKLLGGHERY